VVFRSVRVKIFLSMLLLVVFSGLAMILFAETVIYQKLRVKLEEKGLAVAKIVAKDCITPIITERYFEMTMMFKDLQESERDIVYMYVENKDGRVLAHTFDNRVPQGLRQALKTDSRQRYSTKELSTDKGRIQDVAVPLLDGQLGVLHMGLSAAAVENVVDDVVKLIVLFSIFILTAGTTASVWLSRTITAPLKKLGRSAEAFGRGEIGSPVSITSADEIGDLARIFNEMVVRRKETEEKIRQGEQFIRDILDTVDEAFIVIDSEFRILTANKAYCNQVGESDEIISGRHCYEISHRITHPCFEEGEECAVRQVFETGRPYTAMHRHTDNKGNILYVETKAYPIKDESGSVTSAIETINNITERHLLEEERLKTQKLESIGTLAGGIAHDFNNLLQSIFGYISIAKLRITSPAESLGMLSQAEKALDIAVNLTKQLLTFSKGGKPVKKLISLTPVIENAAKFALSGSRSNLQIDIEPGLWQVDADDGQLGQAIQNIVLNASQAMPEGGVVGIAAKNVERPDKENRQRTGGKYVEISVTDSGVGIAEKYLQKIFDPYFTTKEKGSGLGLATSYSIMRNHGGSIDVTSVLGKGTTFRVYLPAAEAKNAVRETTEISPSNRRGKILVMDDEELVRDIAGELLKALGQEVDFADRGEVAIEKYKKARESGNPFDVVILDLTIRGGLGGKDTFKRLRAIDPQVQAIVSSGYSSDDSVAEYEKYGFAACLSKPYRIGDLRKILNAVLGAKSQEKPASPPQRTDPMP
jgi:PAS domain S-box-containing protein